MLNLLKMDLFKLRKTKSYFVYCAVIFFITMAFPIVLKILVALITHSFTDVSESPRQLEMVLHPCSMSEIFSDCFGGVFLLWIVVLVSATNFLYLDLSGGFVKNIVGQIPYRSRAAISKYIVVAVVHNLILMLCGVLGTSVGMLTTRGIQFDDNISDGLLYFLLKFLIAASLTAVLLFCTTGLHNKTLSTVFSVIFGLGMMQMIYSPLSFGLSKLFNTDINLIQYSPSMMLLSPVLDTAKASIASLAVLVLFLFLTVKLVDCQDTK